MLDFTVAQFPFRKTIPLILAFTLAGLSLAQASGTYPPAPPRLRADITQNVDPEMYNLGKLIYAGRAKLAGEGLSQDQISDNLRVLRDVVGRIPERAQSKIEILQLARQLNDQEESAFLYYLRLRFRLEEVSV